MYVTYIATALLRFLRSGTDQVPIHQPSDASFLDSDQRKRNFSVSVRLHHALHGRRSIGYESVTD
jgi:hypothetical protein